MMKSIEELQSLGINTDVISEFWGDVESYNEGLNDYINSLDERLNDLRNYLNNNNLDDYATLAHSLKSEAKYLGMVTYAETFLDHELKGKEHNGDYLKEHFKDLEMVINKIKTI